MLKFTKEFLQISRELLLIVPAYCSYYLITEHLISLNLAEGQSMVPSLDHGDLVLVQKSLYNITKGDIIIAKSPIRPEITVCKRIIHLAHEQDPYGNKVPKNHVWIEGDNSAVSFDSRFHGPIPINLIEGRVITKF